jgi:molecular chaperone HtpG
MTDSTAAQGTAQYTFKAEIQQLLNILIHSLYTEREIFLRELISNSSDALNRAQFEALTHADMHDAGAPLEIRLTVDEAANTLTVHDTGIGMTRDELAENLGVIAHSGARAFMNLLQERGASGGALTDVIGQFGVGFYSAFMVADRIRVVSRSHHADGQAWAWESSGGETYTIEPAEREARGTSITLFLKDDAKDFTQTWQLRDVVRRHSDYIAFPIYLGADATEPVNRQQAIWRQDPKEIESEAYHEFYKAMTLDFADPLHTVHTRAEGSQEYFSLLFVPASAEKNMLSLRQQPGLKLYARKVLIDEYNTDLLPDYLNAFVQGVVDSEDIPLNVSRESVQATRVMANLKKSLTGKLLGDFKRLMKKDPAKYAALYAQFGRYLKQGLVTTPGDRESIEPLLMFASTKSADEDDLITLETCAERMAANQQDLYYVVASDYAGATRSPHLDAFRQRGIEVLFFTDPIDSFMLMGLTEFRGHTLRSADDAAIDLSGIGEVQEDAPETAEPLADDAFEQVRGRFAEVLGARVESVREGKSLVGSPARLVSKDGNAALYRVNRLFERETELPVKTLELNPRHPLIKGLSERLAAGTADDALTALIAEQVFETALLQDGLHPDPASMAERLYALMEAAARNRA